MTPNGVEKIVFYRFDTREAHELARAALAPTGWKERLPASAMGGRVVLGLSGNLS